MHVGCRIIGEREIYLGVIYATRVANYLGIAPREGDMIIPPVYLDKEAMFSHQFLDRNEQFFLID